MNVFMSWFLLALLVSCYAQFVEPRWFQIRRTQVKSFKKISKPFTILHLSDTHFAKNNSTKEKFFRKLSETIEPDFIFVTGDIIDCDDGIEPAAQILGNLKAKIGKFAVFGNHDYCDYHFFDNFKYHLRGNKLSGRPNNIQWFRKRLEDHGVHVLVNENKSVTVNGTHFVIAGTDDPVTQTVDFEKTLRGVGRGSINILLTHVIDSILKIPNSVVDLALAGHTHGGQFRIPWVGGFVYGFKLPRKYLEGVHAYHHIVTSVSRGLGASRTLTPRLFCRPEAILLEVSG